MITNYTELTDAIAQGWNTWNTRSVLSFVKLPEGFSVNLGVKEYRSALYLGETLIGRKKPDDETVRPGNRSWDGSYIELDVSWQDIEFGVQSTVVEGDLVVLVTVKNNQKKPALLVVEAGFLWNRKGTVAHGDGHLIALGDSGEISVFATGQVMEDPYIPAKTPYFCRTMDSDIGISTGHFREREEIVAAISAAKKVESESIQQSGDIADARRAIKTVMAWDTVYDPKKKRVISPVSRIWSVAAGGYTLFDWDTYFAALLASVDNREIAYANAIAITREITEPGFIPNFATATGFTSLDRSQPPVGSMVVRELFKKFQESWLLKEVYGPLLKWNRWWADNRDCYGYLCWGSNPYEPVFDAYWETHGVAERFGAALESGLDNSPMYDDQPFDTDKNVMLLADVGLMGMYIGDCVALAEIASVLGKFEDVKELRGRREQYASKLGTLWSEEVGLFLNKRLDTGAFETRLSPTHFYPLIAGVPDSRQAERMIREHLLNEKEFWSEYVLPSISRNDKAFGDQDYWRGRIWAPMNFLTYLGLKNYDFPEVTREFAHKSLSLLMTEWRENGYVCENYHADTGAGADRANSDRYYHWGALLALIYLMEVDR